jgi:hypothetical protein
LFTLVGAPIFTAAGANLLSSESIFCAHSSAR